MKDITRIENLTIIQEKEISKIETTYDCIILKTLFSSNEYGKSSSISEKDDFITNNIIFKLFRLIFF